MSLWSMNIRDYALLSHNYYKQLKGNVIATSLIRVPGQSAEWLFTLFLAGENVYDTEKVAVFVNAAFETQSWIQSKL